MREAVDIGGWDGSPFECAPGLKLRAHEQLSQVQIDGLNKRLDRLEELIERLERRLWLTVYGVVGVILAEAFQSVVQATP